MTPTMTKYSQGNEQGYILDAVKHIAQGRLLDIGAWHPTVFSNSRALIEMGWSGLLVEPSPEPLVNLLKEYGRSATVQVMSAAVVSFDVAMAPMVPMHITADAVSTTDDREYDKWKSVADFIGDLIVPAIAIGTLWDMFGPFDFVNIDTEGTSVDIFKALMSSVERARITHDASPACVCVEHNERREEVYLAGKDFYRVVHANETNLVLKSL